MNRLIFPWSSFGACMGLDDKTCDECERTREEGEVYFYEEVLKLLFCRDCYWAIGEDEINRRRKNKLAADREMSKTYYNDHGGYDWNNRDA